MIKINPVNNAMFCKYTKCTHLSFIGNTFTSLKTYDATGQPGMDHTCNLHAFAKKEHIAYLHGDTQEIQTICCDFLENLQRVSLPIQKVFLFKIAGRNA